MSETDTRDRCSTYAVWVDLNRALLDDIASNKSAHSSYRSPITVSSIDWMAKAGEAIKTNDAKTAYGFLWNIAKRTMEAIHAHDQGLMPDKTEEWMKPFYEFNQAADILLVRIEKPAF